VWWDIWDSIGPLIASVIGTGKAVWVDDLLLPVITGGRRGQRYFTFSYSPLMGDTGVVYGVMATVSETTERVLSTRRLHLLNAVAAARPGCMSAPTFRSTTSVPNYCAG
jgi:hypothetical protein